jgi:hypothetical protein
MKDDELYPTQVLPCLALRSGGRLADVQEWRGSLLWFRDWATRAQARWWLEVVPEPRV